MAARQHCPQHGDGLRFVVFNADQRLARLQNVHQDAHAFNNLRRALLHQTVVGSDIRLAFSRVDDECFNAIAAAFQL